MVPHTINKFNMLQKNAMLVIFVAVALIERLALGTSSDRFGDFVEVGEVAELADEQFLLIGEDFFAFICEVVVGPDAHESSQSDA